MSDAEVYASAAVLGAVAGMRSMSAPAVVSRLAKSGLLSTQGSRLGFLASGGALKTTAVLAVGELIADKLPFIPKRTAAGPLIGRTLSGALSGVAVTLARKRSWWAGALIGAAAAVGTTYGMYHARRWADNVTKLPDPVLALIEDALVAGCAALVVNRLRAQTAPSL